MLHDILKHGLWNRWLNICVTLSKLLNPAWSLKLFIHNLESITGNNNAIFTRWLWLLTEIIHEIYLRLNGCSINMNFLSLLLLPFLGPPKIYTDWQGSIPTVQMRKFRFLTTDKKKFLTWLLSFNIIPLKP